MAAMAMGLSLMRKSRKKSGSSRSPPKEKEKEKEFEKTVYLCGNTHVAGTSLTDWYVINLSSKDYRSLKKRKKTEIGGKGVYMTPLLTDTPVPWNSTCCVSVGSTIYSLGALQEFSRDVLAWDTTNTSAGGWEAVTSMNIKREEGHSKAVTAAGKIYVFGGTDWSYDAEDIDEKYLCEVFDPTKNKWEPINPPPPQEALPLLYGDYYEHVFAVYDDTSSRILFGSLTNGFLVAYHVSAASWNIPRPMLITEDEEEFCTVCTSSPALFDNTLYWIKTVKSNSHRCGIYAYDFDLEKLFYAPIVGVHPYFWDCPSCDMQFLHFRGDEFYLIWHHSPDFVRFERMQISKREDSMTCYVLSTKTYVMRGGRPCAIRVVL